MRGAVFCLSGAILAYEVCLLRALAIADFSHAAALVVSVALLGFGASGVLLALFPALRRPVSVAACAVLFAVAVPTSFRVAGFVDFNVLAVGWEPMQWLRLLALQGVFLAPFLCGGLGVAIALALWQRRAGVMYAWNLFGSALGAWGTTLLLRVGPPEVGAWGLALVATASAVFVAGKASKFWAAGGLVVLFLLGPTVLAMSPFKYLQSAPGRKILETRYSVRGRVDRAVVAGLHHAPGLSLVSEARIPPQNAAFLDGHLVAALDDGTSAYLDDAVGALPFVVLGRTPPALLLGVGPDLARAETVVDANVDLLRVCRLDGIDAPPRALLRARREVHDLILHHVSDLDPLHETPLLTVEGFREVMEHVAEDGAFAVSTPLTIPPRPGLKLLATAERVTPYVIGVRSLDRLCVVLRHRETSAGEWKRVDDFCLRLGFDVVRPLARRSLEPFHESDTPLLDPGPDHPFDVRPATDARPYFHRYFRWARLSDLLDREAVPFVQWGFVSALVSFGQVLVLAVFLLLVPLVVSRAARASALLFLALGLAYMLVEMGCLSLAVVRTGSPTLAASVVIGAFLFGSGLGALSGDAWGRPLRRAALLAAAFAAPVLLWLPSHPVGIAFVCAVLAFPMGMPFPAALARLPSASVPWALAVNGVASVAAAAGAPLLSSTFSIHATVATGAALYLLVALLPGRTAGELRGEGCMVEV